MRNILIISCIIFTFSCEDFLEVSPETLISENNFFSTEDDFDQAVSGAYVPLMNLYRRDWILSEMRSDNTHFTYNIGQRGPKPEEDIATFLVESNNRNPENKWIDNYQIISRTNKIIESISEKDFSADFEEKILGESLFLRAFAYFDLVKNFGGVPLILENVNSYNSSFYSRSDEKEIYEQIIIDLQDSRTHLKGQENRRSNRASFGSASTLLGYVYMTLKNWEEAEIVLLDVVEMDYELVPNFRSIFDPNNEGNKEMIFEVDYLDGTGRGTGNDLPYQFIPDLADPSLIIDVSLATRRPAGLAGFNIPTIDLIDKYDKEKDERLTGSIGFYTGDSPLQGIEYSNFPYIRKYLFPHAQCCETGQNFPVFRFAEVLLMMAESLNEQGRIDESLQYINQVRDRAGLDNLVSVGQNELRSSILLERRLELAFENKRWHDLVRTDRGVDVMNAFGDEVKSNPQAYYYPTGVGPIPSSYNVTRDKYIYPIPITEITINSDLEQNPGY